MSARSLSRRRKRKGLFMTWAGDSPMRRFVAWVGQTALIVAMGVAVIAIVMQILLPMMTDGLIDVFRNSTR